MYAVVVDFQATLHSALRDKVIPTQAKMGVIMNVLNLFAAIR